MAIEDAVKDITARLREGRYPNEQAISQGVVLRVLSELGWPTWDTTIVWPEYQTGEGRADFALCHPASRPAIVIEVKSIGRAEEGVRQALEYAFHTGVPMVVLTDGKTWAFYLPGEQGSYEDRRVYKLDLFERPTEEGVKVFKRYLDPARVASQEALETARSEYRNRNRQAQARAGIPDAWRELVEKGDELLVQLVAEAVESRIGIRPDGSDVAEYLLNLGTPAAVAPLRVAPDQTPQQRAAAQARPPRPAGEGVRRGTLTLLGQTYEYATAVEAMTLVLTKLAERDSGFLERCSRHPDAQGRTRRYIARSVDDLYPERPDLRIFNASLPGGWYVGTNINNVTKRSILKMAAEVAGIRMGTDLVVEI